MIVANLQVAQFFDVELDLRDAQYRPFCKPNSDPLYINSSSNHPPAVIRQVPDGVARRHSNISSSPGIFKQSVPVYEVLVDLMVNCRMSLRASESSTLPEEDNPHTQ